MMAALKSLSDTFHIWLILSLAQIHCLFLFKLWFLDSWQEDFWLYTGHIICQDRKLWILFRSYTWLAIVLRLVPRLWLAVWCCGPSSSLVFSLVTLFCSSGLLGTAVVAIGPSRRGRASASGRIRPPWPGRVAMGSLLLVLPSCLVFEVKEGSVRLCERRGLSLSLLFVGSPLHPPCGWCWPHLLLSKGLPFRFGRQ